MSGARSNRGRAGLRHLVVALVYLASAVAARPDLTVTNAAGVRAGITGIVIHTNDGSLGIDYIVSAPTTTNVTTFVVQKNFDLTTTNWVNYTPTFTVTGNTSGEASDFPSTPKQFYRV